MLSAVERERHTLLSLISELVATESPSDDRAALDVCGDLVAARLRALGAEVSRVAAGTTTDHVVGHWRGAGPRVLLLGHFDTVWPVGQLARMPLEERDGKLYGPGILDMKAGLAIAMLAAAAVGRERPVEARPDVTLFATSDEETGSATSRPHIERLAHAAQAVLVLEPALPGGALKTGRKGVGEFRVDVTGVSSHAGADPAAGASAISELARQIAAIEALADRGRGVTLNVGVVAGGTRSNGVAERAHALVDVRIARLADAPMVESALLGLRARDPRVSVSVTGRVSRPPMERTPGVAALYALAERVGRELGLPVAEGSTGGASDGNFTAALGVPTLDGLGAIGDGPHALHEHVLVDALVPRASLVAGLLCAIADNGV